MSETDSATENRTVSEAFAVQKLLRNLEDGDEILYRSGAASGSDDRVQELTVTNAGVRNADSDQARVDVEGPRGGEYAIYERDTSAGNTAKISYSGHKSADIRDLTLVTRDGSEEVAQDVFDSLFAPDETLWTEREIVFQEPVDDIDPILDQDSMGGSGFYYRCEIDDDGRFRVTPTLSKGDLHIARQRTQTYGNKRTRELIFEDDYETIVQDGAKEAIKALDWETAHGTFDGDASVWKIDRRTLAYSLQMIVDPEETDGESWSVTVSEKFADASTHRPRSQVPGLDEDGGPIEAIEFLEADESAQPAAEDVESDSDEIPVPHYVDDDAAEEALSQVRERPDYEMSTDGGQVEDRYFEDKAAEFGLTVEEVKERLGEYGIETF